MDMKKTRVMFDNQPLRQQVMNSYKTWREWKDVNTRDKQYKPGP